MKQTLSKLVDVILERLAEDPDEGSSESGIRSWLLRQGYNQRDIDAALKMITPRFAADRASESGLGKVRHLSDYEQYRMTPEAQAALARLEMYELIDAYERELILERLDQFDGPVALPDLEYLVNWIVCPMRDVETQQTIYSVLDGPAGTHH